MNVKTYLKNLFTWKYMVKCLIIWMLLPVHTYTKYPSNNRFEIFNWPEGFCVNMLVVFGILGLFELSFRQLKFFTFIDAYRIASDNSIVFLPCCIDLQA